MSILIPLWIGNKGAFRSPFFYFFFIIYRINKTIEFYICFEGKQKFENPGIKFETKSMILELSLDPEINSLITPRGSRA